MSVINVRYNTGQTYKSDSNVSWWTMYVTTCNRDRSGKHSTKC